MIQATVNNQLQFSIEQKNGEWFLNYAPANLDIAGHPNGLISVIYQGKSLTAVVEKIDREAKEVRLVINGQVYKVAIQEEMDLLLSKMGINMSAARKAEPVKAPMPGMILKILVQPGQQIQKGDGLLILEAMKMENVLKASHDALVKSIKVETGKAVEKGTVLIELE